MIYSNAMGKGLSIERTIDLPIILIQPITLYWANFFKEEHTHHNTLIISDLIDLIGEEIKEWQHNNKKVGVFEYEIQHPELMCKLEGIKLSNILLTIKMALKCEICSREMGGIIRNQQQTIIQCFYLYSQRFMIDFQTYSIYYDIMHIIYELFGCNQKVIHGNILERQAVSIDYKYLSLWSGRFGQYGIRLMIVILLAQTVERLKNGENKKIIDRVFQLWKQNNRNDDLTKFLIEIIMKKELTVLLGDYFFSKITLQLIDFVKCQTCYSDNKLKIISALERQVTKIEVESQHSDKKEKKQIQIQTFRIHKVFEYLIMCRKEDIIMELQMAITSLQSAVGKPHVDVVLQKDIHFLSSFNINAKIKFRQEKVEVLKRLVDLSRQFPALVKPSIKNSLAILEISQFVDIMNETLYFCCEQSKQTYRQNLKQHLKDYTGITKQINLIF